MVADSDSVSGEDDADPMFYPEESYKTSSHQNMDRQQVRYPNSYALLIMIDVCGAVPGWTLGSLKK